MGFRAVGLGLVTLPQWGSHRCTDYFWFGKGQLLEFWCTNTSGQLFL